MTNVVYICSAGHSGSTLLDLLIGSHSKVTSLGEISHLPKNLALDTICTCGERVTQCRVWSRIIDELSDELGVSIRDDPYKLKLGYHKAKVIVDREHQNTPYLIKRKIFLGLWYAKLSLGIPVPAWMMPGITEAARNSFMLYQRVNKLLNTNLVVDSSKNYLRALSIYNYAPERTKIIVLSRDGRGVYYSSRKRGVSREESLNAWKKYYLRAIPLLTKHVRTENVFYVKYEELAENPKNILKDICDFLELDFEENMLDPSTKEHHIANGNNMRFKKLDIKPDYTWKDMLNKSDAIYFENNAKDLNNKLGYK